MYGITTAAIAQLNLANLPPQQPLSLKEHDVAAPLTRER
uniref:Uncharacterized protein n=1 Tax=Anguilla anguilla TaxID=7936 RepID=A0A0E9RP56_ANGAN